jgi:hypothetical protein
LLPLLLYRCRIIISLLWLLPMLLLLLLLLWSSHRIWISNHSTVAGIGAVIVASVVGATAGFEIRIIGGWFCHRR